jgi:HK97 gp10 family phage protein
VVASALEGVPELTAALNELGVKLAAKQLVGTVKDAMAEAEHRARARLPQGTEPHKTYRGRLVSPGYAISTLHVEAKLDKRTGSAVALLGVGREAFYAAIFVELGTVHSPAQPWLRPSFEDSEEPMLQQIGRSLKDRVERTRKSAMRAQQRARTARR